MAAETFLFNIADRVLGKLGSLALQEVCLAWGLKSELENLQSTLSTIQAVLLDAEEQQAKNRQLTNWLGKIKDALYDADDVLDEFQYEDLRKQAVNHGEIKRKVRNFLSRSNPLVFRFKMGHKIKGIREKLDALAAEKVKFHLMERVIDRGLVYGERDMTHSFVHASDVLGRDADKEKLVQLLMLPSDVENVSIIPIIGIGGLGKTTLAKLVYNDERVVGHFELKMWVCVSEDFDVIKLTKEIFKSATGNNCNDLTIDHLQSYLRRILDNKKFLLILDDVWSDDRGKWLELKDLLLGGANGSKIIVTTRSRSVAFVMGTNPTHELTGLSPEDSLSLFVKWAFKQGEERSHPNLLKIGDRIVRKCVGVPLALRTLGSLLYSKTDEHEWILVKDNEIWKLEQKENDILPALKLSYDAMPSYLKQCFSYCSIFPKDYVFNNIELTYLWIAQGLIQPFTGINEELEDIGHRYFKELWSKSFFQEVEEYNSHLQFKMHDLVHDLAQSVAQSECSIVNDHMQNISKRVRHISFCDDNLWKNGKGFPEFLLELDNVRTILFLASKVGLSSQSFVETSISRFNYVRVLDLSNSSFEILPIFIGNLKHLRYLCLFGNQTLKKLPNSICKLHNLQTLDLGRCGSLEELPRDIWKLISLRYLLICTRQIILLEEGIGCLNSLRRLVIRSCVNLKSLGEGMQRLTALRTLIIWGCPSLEDSLPRILKYLPALETLHICASRKLKLMEGNEDIQEGLRLSLRSLAIEEQPQLVVLPQWLQGAANTLQLLCLRNCLNLRALPEWLQNFTSLRRLEVRYCSKLSALPEGMHRLTALRELKILDCSYKLMKRCKQETGKDWPNIAHIPKITLKGIISPSISDSEEETSESSYSTTC